MTKTSEKKKDLEQLYSDAETKRKELEEKLKGKVKMTILTTASDEKPCVVYFRTATTFTKMQCMDLAYQSDSKASATMFEATVIREASDARVFQQNNDEDAYYLGALEYCLNSIIVARNALKKN
jgi:hypothetical protein